MRAGENSIVGTVRVVSVNNVHHDNIPRPPGTEWDCPDSDLAALLSCDAVCVAAPPASDDQAAA